MRRYYDRAGCRRFFSEGEGGGMIEVRLDKVVGWLEDYLDLAASVRTAGEQERDVTEGIEELKKVIAYRGNVLFIMRRVKRFREYFLAIGRGKTA